MILKDFMQTLTGSDMLHIIKDRKDVYVGYKDLFYTSKHQEVLEETVKLFRAVPELRHKQWQELGLDAPIKPNEAPQYSFNDLRMTLYYTIILQGKEGKVQCE